MKELLKNWAVFGIVLCLCTAAFGLNLQVTPANLYFTAYEAGEDPAPKALTIKNLTSVSVDWQIVDANDVPLSPPDWLLLSSLSGSLDPNGMPGSSSGISVGINVDPLEAGYSSYAFYILSGAERYTVNIVLEIVGPEDRAVADFF